MIESYAEWDNLSRFLVLLYIYIERKLICSVVNTAFRIARNHKFMFT